MDMKLFGGFFVASVFILPMLLGLKYIGVLACLLIIVAFFVNYIITLMLNAKKEKSILFLVCDNSFRWLVVVEFSLSTLRNSDILFRTYV